MSKEQAMQIIEQALNAATQKGAYNLTDASHILTAINILKATIEQA